MGAEESISSFPTVIRYKKFNRTGSGRDQGKLGEGAFAVKSGMLYNGLTISEICSYWKSICNERSINDMYTNYIIPNFFLKRVRDNKESLQVLQDIINGQRKNVENKEKGIENIKNNSVIFEKNKENFDHFSINIVKLFSEISNNLVVKCPNLYQNILFIGKNDIVQRIEIISPALSQSLMFAATSELFWIYTETYNLLGIFIKSQGSNQDCISIDISKQIGKQPSIVGVNNGLLACDGKKAVLLSKDNKIKEFIIKGGALKSPLASDGCNIFSFQSSNEIGVFKINKTTIDIFRTIKIHHTFEKAELTSASMITNGAIIEIIIPPPYDFQTAETFMHNAYLFDAYNGNKISVININAESIIKGAAIDFVNNQIYTMGSNSIVNIIPYEGPHPASATGIDFKGKSNESLESMDHFLQNILGTGLESMLVFEDGYGASEVCDILNRVLTGNYEDNLKIGFLKTGLSVIAAIAHAGKLTQKDVRSVSKLLERVEQGPVFHRAFYTAIETFPELFRIDKESNFISIYRLLNQSNQEERDYFCRMIQSKDYLFKAISQSSFLPMISNLNDNFDIVYSYTKAVFNQIDAENVPIAMGICCTVINNIKNDENTLNNPNCQSNQLLMLVMESIPLGMKCEKFVNSYVQIAKSLTNSILKASGGKKVSEDFVNYFLATIYLLMVNKPDDEVLNLLITVLNLFDNGNENDASYSFLYKIIKDNTLSKFLESCGDYRKLFDAVSGLSNYYKDVRFAAMIVIALKDQSMIKSIVPQNEEEKEMIAFAMIATSCKPEFEIDSNTIAGKYLQIKLNLIEANKEMITSELFQTSKSDALLFEIIRKLPVNEQCEILDLILTSVGSLIELNPSGLSKPYRNNAIQIIENASSAVRMLIEIDTEIQEHLTTYINGIKNGINQTQLLGLLVILSNVFIYSNGIQFNPSIIKNVEPFIEPFNIAISTSFNIKHPLISIFLLMCMKEFINLPEVLEKIDDFNRKTIFRVSDFGLTVSPIVKGIINEESISNTDINMCAIVLSSQIRTLVFIKKTLQNNLEAMNWDEAHIIFATELIFSTAFIFEQFSFDIPQRELPINLLRNIYENDSIECNIPSYEEMFYSARKVYKYLMANHKDQFNKCIIQYAEKSFDNLKMHFISSNSKINAESTERFKYKTIITKSGFKSPNLTLKFEDGTMKELETYLVIDPQTITFSDSAFSLAIDQNDSNLYAEDSFLKLAVIFKYLVLFSKTSRNDEIKKAALNHLYKSINKGSPFFVEHSRYLLWFVLKEIKTNENFFDLFNDFETENILLKEHLEMQKIRLMKQPLKELPQSTLESNSLSKLMVALLPPHSNENLLLKVLLINDWANSLSKYPPIVITFDDKDVKVAHISFPVYLPEKIIISNSPVSVLCDEKEIPRNEEGTFTLTQPECDLIFDNFCFSKDLTVEAVESECISQIALSNSKSFNEDIERWIKISTVDDQKILNETDSEKLLERSLPLHLLKLRLEYLKKYNELISYTQNNGPFARFNNMNEYSKLFPQEEYSKRGEAYNIAVSELFLEGKTDDIEKTILAQYANRKRLQEFVGKFEKQSVVGSNESVDPLEQIIKEISSEKLGLFVKNEEGLLMPKYDNSEGLKFLYEAIGLLLADVVRMGVSDHVSIPFSQSVWQFLAGRRVNVEDILFMKSEKNSSKENKKIIDEVEKRLEWIRESFHKDHEIPSAALQFLASSQ